MPIMVRPELTDKQTGIAVNTRFNAPSTQQIQRLSCVKRILLAAQAVLICFFTSGCGLLSPKTDIAQPAINCTGVVKTAYGQIGKKYRLGGASPQKGFDCSGLVWWSYKQHGVNVPRITSDQAKAGKKISPSAARPGDIVVFKTSNSPRGLHTGIYAGKDCFIHSPRKGKTVCVEKLSGTHWRKKLIAVRRVGK